MNSQGCHLTVAALLLSVAGCASAPEKEIDPDLAERLVVEAPGKSGGKPAPDAAARAAAAQSALAAAQDAWRSGDALSTLAIVNHAMVAGGIPAEIDPAFRDLRAKARSSVVATKVCRVRALPGKDVVADGSPVPLRIEFANLSTATLTVPRAQEGTSDALVILKLTRADFDIYGNERSSDYTLPVQVKEDLVLGPGRTHEVLLTIPSEMTKLGHTGFSVMTLSGSFRPVVMRVGETEFFDAIPIEKALVRIFLAGFEPLAKDPLESMKKAVAKRSPPHILTAVELLAPRDRDEARAFLLEAKTTTPELTQVLDASLARIPAAR